jgi:EmrB/QacA subfamily drug resistance transporter
MNKSQKWIIAVVVSLGMAMATLDATIVSVILAQLQDAFHTDFETINWVSSGYFLAQAAVVPIIGYLSDRLGSKWVFITALAVFTAASLLCALSPTKEALIAFRVLQGIGGGGLVPMAFAIIYRIFPPNERGKVTGVVSLPIMLAPAFGPTLGGYLSTNFNSSAVFMVNVPFGIVVVLLSFLVLPRRTLDQSEQTPEVSKSFDILGLLLSMVGVTMLVCGVSLAAAKGWGDVTVWALLAIGTVFLIVFIIVELRVSDPVLDLRLFRNYTFSISNILMWLTFAVFAGGLFLLPLFFEKVQGDTSLVAGSYLIGQGLAITVGIFTSGLLYNRIGPRFLMVFGLLVMIVGTYGLTQIDVHTTGQDLQLWLILRGFGLGLTYQPLQTLTLSVVSNKGMAKASSLVSTARQVTTAVAVALLTTYLAQQTITHENEIGDALQAGLRTHNLTGVAATCVAGPTLNPTALKLCVEQHALATGMADTFWFILILTATCVPLALVAGRDPAVEVLKQAKRVKASDPVAIGQAQGTVPTAPEVQIKGRPGVISIMTASGEEMMGPDILLWRYSENNIANGSLLTVGGNHFCVLKLFSTILNVYETGQHVVKTPDSPHSGVVQLSFSGEPLLDQYEVLYVNRARLIVKARGVALSHEMVEVDYSVDYYIHVATREDAILLIQRMPSRGHSLNIREVNAYAQPIIEEAVKELMLMTPLDQVNRKMQDLSQLVCQSLQKFLSPYGITVDTVHVLVSPRDQRVKALLSLKAFGLSELDAVRYSTAMANNSKRTNERK